MYGSYLDQTDNGRHFIMDQILDDIHELQLIWIGVWL